MIELKGMSTKTFLKDFAAKYGIGVDYRRHGKFNCGRTIIRNDISRKQRTTFYSS